MSMWSSRGSRNRILEEPQKAFWGPHFWSHFGLIFGYYIKYVRSTWETWVEISLAHVRSLTSSMHIVNIVILHSTVIVIWNFCCLYMWSIISFFFFNQVRFTPGVQFWVDTFFFCKWPDNKLDFASHKDSQPLDVKSRLIASWCWERLRTGGEEGVRG